MKNGGKNKSVVFIILFGIINKEKHNYHNVTNILI